MKRYQYILTYSGVPTTLTKNPAGWNRLGLSMAFNEVYSSRLRSFTLSLRFVNKAGSGYDIITYAYEQDGNYANVLVTINERNPNTNGYDLLYSGSLDFATNRWKRDRDLFIEIPIIDSDKLQKFISRDENEINIISDKTLDGDAITPLSLSTISLTPVNITTKSIFDSAESSVLTWALGNQDPKYWYLHDPVYSRNEVDNIDIQGVPLIYTNNGTDTRNVRIINAISYDYDISFTIIGAGTLTISISAIHYNSSNVEVARVSSIIITHALVAGSNVFHDIGNFSYTASFDAVEAGGYIELRLFAVHDVEGTNTITINDSYNFTLTEVTLGRSTTSCGCVFPKQAFTRAIEINTGVANNFDCDLMDGSGALAKDAIFTGRHARMYPSPMLNVKFRELFKTFDAIHNLMLGHDSITNRFYINSKSAAFADNLLFELGEVSKFTVTPLPNAYFSKILAGFDYRGSYERVSGASEFAVKREYSTASKVKEENNIMSPYRGDSVGIEDLRGKIYMDSASEDNDSDSSVFVVRTDGVSPILPSVGDPPYLGMDVFSSYYNTMLTPRQNTMRWINVLSACHYRTIKDFQAQKTEKQFDLAVDGVDENSDITSAEMVTPLFIPEVYTFECYLSRANLTTLLQDSNGFISFAYNATRYEGHVKMMELGVNNRKARFELFARALGPRAFTFENGDDYEFEDGTQKYFDE